MADERRVQSWPCQGRSSGECQHESCRPKSGRVQSVAINDRAVLNDGVKGQFGAYGPPPGTVGTVLTITADDLGDRWVCVQVPGLGDFWCKPEWVTPDA